MNQYHLLAAVIVRFPWRSRHSSQFRFVIISFTVVGNNCYGKLKSVVPILRLIVNLLIQSSILTIFAKFSSF